MAIEKTTWLVCDRCGKRSEAPEVSMNDDSAVAAPSFIAFMEGEPVAEFSDLCDDCHTKLRSNIDRYVKVGVVKRVKKDVSS